MLLARSRPIGDSRWKKKLGVHTQPMEEKATVHHEEDDQIEESPVQQIESLCMNCHENGITNLLLTRIPYFLDVIVMAFSCPHCGYRSSDLQQAEFQTQGCRYTLQVRNEADLNRQIVRGHHCSVHIPNLGFEIEPSGRGEVTTLEGLVRSCADRLSDEQEGRRAQDPETAMQLDMFIARLRALAFGDTEFTIILDDPTGNSFLENLCAPSPDPQVVLESYTRTRQQNIALGINVGDEIDEAWKQVDAQGIRISEPAGDATATSTTSTATTSTPAVPPAAAGPALSIARIDELRLIESECLKIADPDSVVEFRTDCYMCHRPGITRMIVATIPKFKEVIVMAFTCDSCGYRNSEIKPGGSMSELGRRIYISVETREDLCRDVLKSDTASFKIPEIGLELAPGSLGGVFTTIEGLITKARDRMASISPQDSALPGARTRLQEFFEQCDQCIAGERPFTMILDDPVGNSYVQDLYHPEEDPRMEIEDYRRTHQQDEDLGLLDMDVRTDPDPDDPEDPSAVAASQDSPAEPLVN
eukprot:gnl/Trimastix_PCT/947.p1 GENE.gnl/Trimastix_PCT/947~~gnl/Trimastix_PCT/947.p1  ORF type:complete len:531 (-),score=156.22 gnl/Trimastix_PCT/947:33-1625(-)